VVTVCSTKGLRPGVHHSTEGDDSASDVGASAQHEVHECAERALEMLDVDLGGREANQVNIKHFQRALGALMCLMLGTHPDIAYTVAANPGIEHQHTPCEYKDVTKDSTAVVKVATPVSVHVPK